MICGGDFTSDVQLNQIQAVLPGIMTACRRCRSARGIGHSSEKRQDGEPKNASHDSKISTSYPNVSTSRPVAARPLSSSSTMDINGIEGTEILPFGSICQRIGSQLNRDFATAINQIRGLIIVSISQLACPFDDGPSLSAIRTNSATDPACIFCITWPRWIFTVASLAPISEAICLLSIPETTRVITSRSRTVND